MIYKVNSFSNHKIPLVGEHKAYPEAMFFSFPQGKHPSPALAKRGQKVIFLLRGPASIFCLRGNYADP